MNKSEIAKKKDLKTAKKITPVNQVFLIGRITSKSGERKLPSGDLVSEFRIVVNRRGRAGSIDTIDIAAWSAKLRKQIKSLQIESWVEVKGSVRRRFWQSASGLASRWQVEANQIRRL